MNKGGHNNDQSQVTERPPDPAPSILPSEIEIEALRAEVRTLRNFIRGIEHSVKLALSNGYKLPEDK